jgi:ABC-type maltose transport system permease subunit
VVCTCFQFCPLVAVIGNIFCTKWRCNMTEDIFSYFWIEYCICLHINRQMLDTATVQIFVWIIYFNLFADFFFNWNTKNVEGGFLKSGTTDFRIGKSKIKFKLGTAFQHKMYIFWIICCLRVWAKFSGFRCVINSIITSKLTNAQIILQCCYMAYNLPRFNAVFLQLFIFWCSCISI